MAVAVFKSSLKSEDHYGTTRMEGKSTGKRRVFVQTETGCVLGMELDRNDNVHTLKRKLQLALNFPAEGSSLTFGDTVLKNDLSSVRNDSPLLLTRSFLHRSSSTPCLSPTGKDIQQKDQSGMMEALGDSSRFSSMQKLFKKIVKGVENGVDPIPVRSGLGGAYYFRNVKGENVAIVKPTDEEPYAPNNPKGFVGKALGQPGLKRSVKVGETGFREVAAYLLDHGHFANVPPTALVKITHSIFNVNGAVNGNISQNKNLVSKIASLQQFIPHDYDASDYGTSSFPVSAVHRIGILDVRVLNTDRHAGNLLVRKHGSEERFGQVELIPIDHGLCLPENLEDPYFEWMHWPQASIPFSDDELEYIANLDPVRDAEMLRNELPMIREACLRVSSICTTFLKEAAAYGMCLSEIGEMMSREFRGGEEEPSELEGICIEARKLVEEDMLFRDERTNLDEFQFEFDQGDDGYNVPTKFTSEKQLHFGFSRLEERIKEEENEGEEGEEDDPGFTSAPLLSKKPTISKLSNSMSMKNTSFGCIKNQKFPKFPGFYQNHPAGSSSSARRSANEQLPPSVSFIKIAEMKEKEWSMFLEKFRELIHPAFATRKTITATQPQRQRLGASCQF